MTPEQREKHRLYMIGWKKNPANRAKMRVSTKNCRLKNSKKYADNFRRKHGCNRNSLKNLKWRKKATQAGRRWDVIEDALLFSGLTESQLCERLGRSLIAVQRRKNRLRQMEESHGR
jgi:hypothetical protein